VQRKRKRERKIWLDRLGRLDRLDRLDDDGREVEG